MLKITKKIEYALMALKYLADHSSKGPISAREISDELKIPFDTTSRVMQILHQQDILKSLKGLHGGYQIEADLKAISYYQLVQFIEGQSYFIDCYQGDCSLIGTCNISEPIKRFHQYTIDFFQTITLYNLLYSPLQIDSISFPKYSPSEQYQ